jgi:hypothetical protein
LDPNRDWHKPRFEIGGLGALLTGELDTQEARELIMEEPTSSESIFVR